MATAVQSLRFAVRRSQCRSPRSFQSNLPIRPRQFTTSVNRQTKSDTDSSAKAPNSTSETPATASIEAEQAPSSELSTSTSPGHFSELRQRQKELRQDERNTHDVIGAMDSLMWNPKIRRAARDPDSPTRPEVLPKRPSKIGFISYGARPEDEFDDPEFEMDDITSTAHGELDQHREFREYARLAAWEMPLLTKMAKPFEPPTQKDVLRFRYTTYMGEEHPAEKKVVVEFCPADMPLTDAQQLKLKKLAGVRYNPETGIIKMSSEMFETQAQNKRYLGDLVDTLVKEAKDPKDDFLDVPLDLRHHPIKVKPKFPVQWRMSESRRAEIEKTREQSILLDQQKEAEGALLDGVERITEAFSRPGANLQSLAALPELAAAGKGKAKGGKKVVVRR